MTNDDLVSTEPAAREPLKPPETVLEPPEKVENVTPTQAKGMVQLEEATMAKLDARVVQFAETIAEADVHSEAFEKQLAVIHNMGTQEIREAANVSNRILNRPIRGVGEDAPVTQSLLALRRTVEELDPARREDADRKLLGIIPLGNKVTDYFRKYQSAQSHIDAVLNSLYHGQDELRKDVATIDQEKVNLWNIMQRLQQYIYAADQLDQALEARIATIEAEDPEKARVVKEEILFYVRQKEQDLMTQLAVSIQGYLALDVIRKNDLELIKGVERATTTTISALRTAVIVAQALSNQRLVLDQITALNTTTSDLIESTSVMLKDQSGEIHRQASESTVNLQQLENAFNNVFATLDMISNYKVEALDSMTQTISLLSGQVQKSQTYLDRVRSRQVLEASEDLILPEPEE
ncbi:MAG: toxic anion resistance protein [Anaerolineales bacterium]